MKIGPTSVEKSHHTYRYEFAVRRGKKKFGIQKHFLYMPPTVEQKHQGSDKNISIAEDAFI